MTQLSPRRLISLCTALLLVTALLPAVGQPGPDETGLMEAGAAALKPFKQQLMSALVQGLKEGPESAIQVCSEVAPAIAAEVSTETVTIGRTSHKLRNPENAPKAWMEPLLQRYSEDPALEAPTLVALPDGGHGYVEPILVRPACLKCHGTTLDPAVKEQIERFYPDDQATGFESGDVRGLFWVELKAQAQ